MSYATFQTPEPLLGREFTVAAPLAERLLNLVLFVTMVTSSLAFIEPSPHDALMFVLAAMCVAARVRFDRKLAPLLILLVAWLLGGLMSVMQVSDQSPALQYAATSIYLGLATLVFACLFSDGSLTRLRILRRAYIIAALIAAAAGYIGFFHLLPGWSIFLTYDRVSATFKDPNLLGPFLIYPLLLLIIDLLTRRLSLINLIIVLTLLGGLFLSFSRGAWGHFAVSTGVATALLLALMRDTRMRYRMVLVGVVAVIAIAVFVVSALWIDSIRDMFELRAQVLQSYDVRPGGRFWNQNVALGIILDNPNGLGPFEFSRIFGEQQHDVYMQGFLVYGWLGGVAYMTLIAVTLVIGLRAVALPAPWQNYLIGAYAAFVGEAWEGFIIDSDHWRHFFLLLGLIWGLIAASINLHRRRHDPSRLAFEAPP